MQGKANGREGSSELRLGHNTPQPPHIQSPRCSLPDNLLSSLIKSDTSVRFPLRLWQLRRNKEKRGKKRGQKAGDLSGCVIAGSSLLYGNTPPVLLLITGAYCKSLLVPLFWLGERKGQRCQGEIDLNGKATLFLFFCFKVFILAVLSLLFAEAPCVATAKSTG